MDTQPSVDITRLLQAWGNGDRTALDELTPVIYRELRRRASNYIKNERPGSTLQATALVHEAWIRLVNAPAANWKDRAHFFAIAAQVMRHILVDGARSRRRDKRGGSSQRVDLDLVAEISPARDRELMAIDDALQALAAMDARKAKVVELRFFGGLSAAESAEVLKVSADTVLRDWRLARSWLLREIAS
ncbi:MAG TPA: sigma-70 family RNA polymerase sigma factor [Candidatus Solibacter sp.]|nr:sigma-70 family RNA polymerase sigma factor [Candidatus Solibacter sp.]